MEAECILRTVNLTKTYSKKNFVNNVSLNIKKGAVYGFIGKNGAGKTTTIKMITGLTTPTSGEVQFSDEFQENPKWRSKISAVIENPAYYPYLTAKQNIENVRLAIGCREKSCTDELIELVGLSDSKDKVAKKFSLGMKQRLAIAMALVGDPEFLFLDEPINGLDPAGVRDVRDLILKLHEKSVTIMISSHILSELLKVATDYGVINCGHLVDEFNSDELKTRLKDCVSVKVNDLQKAVTLVSDELKISDYRIEGNEIKFYTNNVRSVEISSLLSKNDIIVESIYSEGGDYEDYFIKLMEKTKEENDTSIKNEENKENNDDNNSN